jgi:predicted nucleic acid-binding protein
VIAVDTNLLVYAHRPEMPFNERARYVLTEAVAATEPVCVPWPFVHEFLAVVSNPRIFRDPTPIDVALDAVRRLLASLSGGFLAEGEGYLDAFERVARPALLHGAIVHDARVAALCLFHGVRIL